MERGDDGRTDSPTGVAEMVSHPVYISVVMLILQRGSGKW